ncbi:hypothetical protein [Leucobacter aridicollis]|uniref:Uncharacterized protein n=1 Tax=Leucobacter aridicollis TaxID=283878 RepID=A0A852R6I2_9MICO|nr:hypothetical protein [Leucobacter aridicollis]MBL3682632.1 hypothetical protein [Leucobacter aridicollis]NYD26059.1 hypothetical protein [Leucobacter aridicollis]
MFRATIRLVETVELEASGESLEEVHAQLEVNPQAAPAYRYLFCSAVLQNYHRAGQRQQKAGPKEN